MRDNPLDGALCVGHHDLFDSVLPFDHWEAREICKSCPVIAACEDRLEHARMAAMRGGDGPQGTWAGRLITWNDRPSRKVRT